MDGDLRTAAGFKKLRIRGGMGKHRRSSSPWRSSRSVSIIADRCQETSPFCIVGVHPTWCRRWWRRRAQRNSDNGSHSTQAARKMLRCAEQRLNAWDCGRAPIVGGGLAQKGESISASLEIRKGG